MPGAAPRKLYISTELETPQSIAIAEGRRRDDYRSVGRHL